MCTELVTVLDTLNSPVATELSPFGLSSPQRAPHCRCGSNVHVLFGMWHSHDGWPADLEMFIRKASDPSGMRASGPAAPPRPPKGVLSPPKARAAHRRALSTRSFSRSSSLNEKKAGTPPLDLCTAFADRH